MARRSKGPWRRKKTTGAWYTQVNGRQIKLAEAHESYDKALQRYHEVHANSARREHIPTIVAELLDEFLVWVHRHRALTTYKWYQGYLRRFHEHIGSTKLISNLKPIDVDRWIEAAGYESSNNRRGATLCVKRACNWAVQIGIISQSPVARMPLPKYERREGFISQARFDKILPQVEDESLRTYLEFMWLTGCRPQEARLISAECFDGRRIVLPIKDSKGQKHNRAIYLPDKAKAIVEQMINRHPTGALFRNKRGNAWVANAVARRVRKYDITLTLIRHSWITRALMNGVDTTTVAVLAGHRKTTMVQLNYQHLALDHDYLEKAAAKAIGA